MTARKDKMTPEAKAAFFAQFPTVKRYTPPPAPTPPSERLVLTPTGRIGVVTRETPDGRLDITYIDDEGGAVVLLPSMVKKL